MRGNEAPGPCSAVCMCVCALVLGALCAVCAVRCGGKVGLICPLQTDVAALCKMTDPRRGSANPGIAPANQIHRLVRTAWAGQRRHLLGPCPVRGHPTQIIQPQAHRPRNLVTSFDNTS